MKRLTLALLLLAPAIAVIPAATADPIVLGPLTFGSNAPICCSSYYFPPSSATGPWNLVYLSLPIQAYSAGVSPAAEITTYTFSFDVAPGWAITDMALKMDGIQAANEDWNSNPPAWGFQIDEELTLCSSSGICSSAQKTVQNGPNAGEGTLALGALVGSGTGVLQIEDSAVDDSFFQDGGDDNVALITVTQVDPTPEPSSWFLLSTGLIGVAFVASRRKPAAKLFHFF